MKFYSIKTLLAAMLLGAVMLPGISAAAQSSEPTLQVAIAPSFVPFEMKDEKTGKMVGFNLDILKALSKRAGFKYKLRILDFSGIIPALQTGSVDMGISGMTITKARAKVVDFSSPFYDSGLRIIVLDSNHSIKKLADLKGKSIGTKIGSTSYSFLEKHFGKAATIKLYPQGADMYLALLTGNVDAVFYDAPNVVYFAKTKGKGETKVVGPLYQGQKYGVSFTKGSPWVKPVDKALASMKADGTYARIYKKWFGKLPPKN